MANIKNDSSKVLEESYIKAKHYKIKNSPFYNIDSSYKWNLIGLKEWPNSDNWKKEFIIRKSSSDNPFLEFKIEIDSLAFSDIEEKNTEKDYQHYINIYKGSPFTNKAIAKRDSLAFSKAKNENTYISYKTFIEKYPNSIQAEEAKEIYDLLLYETHTRDRYKESYENFIDKFPHSPYLNEAVTELFEIYTLDHQRSSYNYFLDKFPNTIKSDEANLWLKHLKFDSSALHLFLAIPSEEKHKLRFLRPDSSIVNFFFDSLENTSICKGLFYPFQIYNNQGKQGLVNSRGQGLIPPIFNDLEKLSHELYSYESKNKRGLVHVSGFMISEPIYDSILVLNDTFLSAYAESNCKLLAYNGKILFEDSLDEISYLGNDNIVLKKEKKMAIIKGESFLEWPNKIVLDFKYDSIYKNQNSHICLLKDQNSLIIKLDLSTFVDIDYEHFEQKSVYYKIYNEKLRALISLEGETLVDWTVDSLFVNQLGFAIKTDTSWTTNFFGLEVKDVDSFNSFIPYFVRLYKNDTLFIQNAESIMSLSEYDEYKIESDPDKLGNNYFTVKKDLKWGLINRVGDIILKVEFEDIKLFPSNLIRVKQKGKYGLKSLNGSEILKTEYDAISNFKNGGFTLFKSGKFGYINPSKNILIKASHKSPPEYIEYTFPIYFKTDNSTQTYYALKNDKKIIEAKGLQKVNDSLFFANQNFQWVLFKIGADGQIEEMNLKCERYKLWNDGTNQSHIVFDYNASVGFFDLENNLKIYPEYYKIYPITDAQGEISIYLTFKYFEEIDIYLLKVMDRDENELYKVNLDAEWFEQFKCKNLHQF
jgi:hypothetical protein